jgi:hypothetical protein
MADMTARPALPPEMEDRPTSAATMTISLRPTKLRLTRQSPLAWLAALLRLTSRTLFAWLAPLLRRDVR